MASTTMHAALFSSLPVPNSLSPSQKPRVCCASLPSRTGVGAPRLSQTRVNAVPEVLGSEEAPGAAEASSAEMAPKQKIRIKLRSYWVPLIEDSCKQIMDAARNTNAKTMGPVPLPTKKRIYCVLKSPHVHKDARFHFEIRTHQRLIDILYPTAQTIDSLMQLDLPAGVDVEVKL
ncbi:hypothetical protein MLD38_022100 [Melastoma candidum]|uniref:Uncharacterized protein n=1 Tax=Melastoma candidum TaxID=119954 RepID=A0ACB9QI67_9MYRT|nr:hypothetical protein MLD38_022100 [Melastoma candidum]